MSISATACPFASCLRCEYFSFIFTLRCPASAMIVASDTCPSAIRMAIYSKPETGVPGRCVDPTGGVKVQVELAILTPGSKSVAKSV